MLLEIEQNLSPLIIENIRIRNSEKINNIKFINGSPFKNDDNNEYKFQKLNEIKEFTFDLYNMNYKIVEERKYVRMENFSEQDTSISDKFRIIILIDKAFIDKIDMAFSNRSEKM